MSLLKLEEHWPTHFQCGSDMYIIMHLCSGHAHATDLIENIHNLVHSCYNFILFQHENGTQKSNFILEVTYKFKISVYRNDILSVNFVIIHIIIIKSSLKNFSY